MRPLHKWLLVAASVVLGACTPDSEEVPAAQAGSSNESPQETTSQEDFLALGRETYDDACASCHEEGVDGAPALGDRDSWSNRSPLWSAVLLEHAKSGYLDMPPKGGHPELTERAVEAAGEFMLGQTFPELLKD